MDRKKVVISMSGGLDSTCLALYYLAKGYEVRAIGFYYGQRHSVELERLKKNIKYLSKKKRLPISLEIIDLKSVFSGSVCSMHKESGNNIPTGLYNEENMKSTVEPNRNVIFSSIVFAKALNWALKENNNVTISLGVHGGDHCFTRDTKIMTPNGYKTIDELNIGDAVYSLDPATGSIEIDKCLDIIHKGTNNEIYTIKTTAGSVRLTSEHEVYIKLECGIVKKKTRELNIGDNVIISNIIDSDVFGNYCAIPIISISIDASKTEDVYDISVEKNHNFFAGDFGSILISNSIYPDCRPESVQAAQELFKISNWDSDKVNYESPFVNIDKAEVLKKGLDAMNILGFNEKERDIVLKNTNSCYNPIHGKSCGKCGTCTERAYAFYKNNISDPAPSVLSRIQLKALGSEVDARLKIEAYERTHNITHSEEHSI